MIHFNTKIFAATLIFLFTHYLSAADTSPVNNSREPQNNEADAEKPKIKQPVLTPEKTETKRVAAIRSTMVLKVLNPAIARSEIKTIVRELGGYATLTSDNAIVVKIPPALLQQALGDFAKSGVVINQTLDRRDLTQEKAQLQASLKSKTEILQKLQTFIDSSDFNSTLEIERSMTQLVNEIEHIKGRLRLLFDSTTWSVVDISFEFRNRENIQYISSPFAWINDANTDSFLENF